MGIRTCRRSCLAILTLCSLTAAVASGDAISSSRRSYQEPAYPEVVVDPDNACSVGSIGEGKPYYPEGYFGPSSEAPSYLDAPYCDGAIGESCDAGYAGCGGHDSELLCCNYCPCWTARAGVVYLRRSSNTAIPIIAGAPPINSRDVGFDYETGPMFTLIRHGIFQSCWDFEATYFGIDSYTGTRTSANATTLFTTPNINFGPTPVRTRYDSEFDSAEFNLRRQWNNWVTLLGGFRWINMNETLNTDIGGAANHRIDVDNQLYGFQLGADTFLWSRGRFSLEAYGKAGVYGNNSDARTTTAGIGGAVPTFAASQNRAAFVGDLGLTGVYDINNRWSLRGGYQMLWLDGVALAPDQLDNMNVTTGAATVDVGSTAFYHGVNLAAEFRY